jgi:hypothetical protein
MRDFIGNLMGHIMGHVMRHLTRMPVAAVAVALFANAALHAQCPAEGDCRKVHASPGCVMPECCSLVCEANPLCCETTWDDTCVQSALDICDGINCPATGECTATHATPGCSDFTCCDLVSNFDGWCSYAAWDEICAREAAEVCGVGRCAIDATGAVDENEPCYKRLNDGCGLGLDHDRIALACGVTFKGRITNGGSRDLDWFALDGAGRRRFRVTVEAEFPLELQYFRGGCEGASDTKWLVAPNLCTGPIAINFIADGGTSSFIIGSGYDDGPLRYGIDCDDIDPDNPPNPDDPPPVQLFGVHWRARVDCLAIGDLDGNGSVGPQDLAMLLNLWGPIPTGVAFDPRAIDADLDGNGTVGAPDIATLLSSW